MLTQTQLKDALTYDPDTGIFRWRIDRRSPIKAGDIAGTFNAKGYRQISIGRTYGAHRLAFLYMTGAFPPDMVDHINGDPADNRWCNLRPATNSENAMNRKVRKTNKIGITGVYAKGDKFAAHICIKGKQMHLGAFNTIAEAKAARENAANILHGEYSRAA